MRTFLLLCFVFTLWISYGISHAAVLAKIGSTELTTEELKQEYDMVTNEQRKTINQDPSTRRSLVDNMVNAEILVQAAQKTGLDKDKDYNNAFTRFRRQYLATKFMQKAVESKLSRDDLKKFFESHKNLFDTSQACAYHIVVQDEQLASKLVEQAKAKGANFEGLAKKHSIDPSVQENKGDLGCFTRDRMVPEFTQAAFSMRKNEVRGPVRTVFGYHVIKLVDIKPGKVPGFEEIEQRVKDTYRSKLVQDLITDLRAKSQVQVNEEEVNKFKL